MNRVFCHGLQYSYFGGKKEKTVSLEVVSIMLPRTYSTPYYGTGLPSPDINIKKEVCWAIL